MGSFYNLNASVEFSCIKKHDGMLPKPILLTLCLDAMLANEVQSNSSRSEFSYIDHQDVRIQYVLRTCPSNKYYLPPNPRPDHLGKQRHQQLLPLDCH